MPIVVSAVHERLTMFSGADVKTRSRIWLNLVGHMFTLMYKEIKTELSEFNRSSRRITV